MIELAHQREEVDDEVCLPPQCEEGSAAHVLVGLKHGPLLSSHHVDKVGRQHKRCPLPLEALQTIEEIDVYECREQGNTSTAHSA